MYIRKTTTSKRADGTRYETYRIVESVRIGGKSSKITLLSIGATFDLDRSLWKQLCQKIEEILYGKQPLFPLEAPPEVEQYAEQFAALILARRAVPVTESSAENPDRYIDGVDSFEADLLHLRSVGGEHVGLHGALSIGLPEVLMGVGFNQTQIATALASIVGRMINPGSEEATWNWLTKRSALGELLDVDFSQMSVMRLHRISDDLVEHRETIEAALFGQIRTVFALEETIALVDLTNTYFEGSMKKNSKAKRGVSKEKRKDAPLMTLGLVLDGSGFVKRSRVFAGNVSEASTVQEMLEGLGAPENSLVVMDRGTATQETIDWLVSHKYRYVVMSREKVRTFDMDKAQTILTAQQQELKVYSEINEEQTELRLYCYSEMRAAKENGITDRFMQNFEEALTRLHEGLSKPRTQKDLDRILQRIGRLQERSRGVSQHYNITVTDNAATKAPNKPLQATGVYFEKKPVEGSMATHPGVYCIRTNALEFDNKTLWGYYAMLNDLEAVFRSLKSELGLRPVYHQTEDRAEGHLFITVLAYQCVQAIRYKLKARGMHQSWRTIREDLSTHQRATITFPQRCGAALHVRRASRPEVRHQEIYNALNITHRPGGIIRTRFPQ